MPLIVTVKHDCWMSSDRLQWYWEIKKIHAVSPSQPTERKILRTFYVDYNKRTNNDDLSRCLLDWGTAVAQWLRCCATNRKVAGSIPAGVSGIFHWHKTLPIALWPWGRLSLYQKWVPEVFPGGKGGRCARLTTLPPSCAVVTKSGNLNFQEPSGPVQACNGTALPLPLRLCRSEIHISRALGLPVTKCT